MIQRISPPLLTVQGREKSKDSGKRLKKGKEVRGRRRGEKRNESRSQESNTSIIKADSSFVQPCH